MFTDWNFWFSVITAVVAIVALMQTKQQIRLSNKQHLFDKRVENYLIAKGLIQLYEINKNSLIVKNDMPMFEVDFIFEQMTNNKYLEKITRVITNPLEEPYHKEFLISMENIRAVSAEIDFIFSGKVATFLGEYVLHYQELLLKMYQYQILLNKMRESAQDFNLTLEEAQEKVNEKKYQEELRKAAEILKQDYDILKKENVEKKVEKQIKLY
ncbi:MAG: hypothetical protein HFJ03_03970 [Lachnospira sp.]|jgi:hypothetical protein|nr:hypothetical protein [Lachnospira sp.]